jgi:endonuclease/exonuclease/phosphatase family metal-dependent hydrolase
MVRIKRILMALAALLTLGTGAAAQTVEDRIELRIMTFNIWLGGDQVNLGRVLDAIRAADADIVCLQEPEGQTRRLAEMLGWPYASERRHVISKYPLFEPATEEADYVLAELVPGRFVAIANIHLTADPYGPYAVRDGQTPEEVLALEEETRVPEIEPYIAALSALAEDGVPVFLAGDFNVPSHLDWTEAVAAQRPQVRFPLEWPVSKLLADAGFRDTYREAHPDPVARLGITWSPGYPVPHLEPEEAVDRIDQVHVHGDAVTVASRIVGEVGGLDVDIGIAPWPSDHRAVVSTFAVAPGAAPEMVSIDRRAVTTGDTLAVRFHAATADGRIEDGRVVVLAAGAPPTDALMVMPTNDGTDRRSPVPFGTASLEPGVYDAALLDAEGRELARAPFWLQAPGSRPEVSVDRDDYADHEPIQVTWRNAPGHRRDWLGIYAAGDPDQQNYLAFAYTGAAIEGTTVFDEEMMGGPLDGGDYEVRLMRDDGYVTLAVSPRFSISTPP